MQKEGLDTVVGLGSNKAVLKPCTFLQISVTRVTRREGGIMGPSTESRGIREGFQEAIKSMLRPDG